MLEPLTAACGQRGTYVELLSADCGSKLVNEGNSKSVIMSVEIEWIRNKWGRTTYNVLGVRHTTRLFLIWRVCTHASAIARLSYLGLSFTWGDAWVKMSRFDFFDSRMHKFQNFSQSCWDTKASKKIQEIFWKEIKR